MSNYPLFVLVLHAPLCQAQYGSRKATQSLKIYQKTQLEYIFTVQLSSTDKTIVEKTTKCGLKSVLKVGPKNNEITYFGPKTFVCSNNILIFLFCNFDACVKAIFKMAKLLSLLQFDYTKYITKQKHMFVFIISFKQDCII